MSEPIRGLLSGLTDPVFMTRIAEQRRIAKRVAEQMGISLQEANRALYEFEACLSHAGHTLH